MMKYIGAQNGKIGVFETEKPQVKDNYVLIKTLYSAISPGTELSMSAASEDRVVALGYSACGEIVEVGDGVEGYKVGDKVASYGVPYTGHREYLSVPKTLIAKVPDNVSDKEASMAGLGAIAIHALRKANLQFGEIIVDAKGQTNVPGVFAAGDCTTVPFKQIVIAAGDGSKAALSAFDYLIRN